MAFRVDASPDIGAGHLMRCLALADALRAAGTTCLFLGRPLQQRLRERVAAHGHEVVEISALARDWRADARACIASLASRAPEWLVVDHYELDAQWHESLQAYAKRLLVIDDLADRKFACDLLLNQNLLADPETLYAGRLVRPGARVLSGPRHALLRAEFRPNDEPVIQTRDVPSLLVMFGGADPHQLALRTLQWLRPLAVEHRLHAVAGPLVDPRPLRDAMTERPGSTLHENLQDVPSLLRQVDLVIGAPGVSTWERCACAVASVTISFAHNQEPVGRSVAEAGAHVYLGRVESLAPKRLLSVVEFLLCEHDVRRAMARAASALTDGAGATRVAREMVAESVSLRLATLSDARMLFDWRNAVSTRAYFVDSTKLTYAQHLNWVRQTLQGLRRMLFVITTDTDDAGSLRLDFDRDRAKVSLYLAPDRVGQGLGRAALRAAERWTRDHRPEIRTLDALILQGNVASERAFVAAGYQRASACMERRLE